MSIPDYVKEISRTYKEGRATEHSYRPALRQLLGSLLPGMTVTNEPKRQECGAPDFILTRNSLPVAYLETKDIGDRDLKGDRDNKEQFDRYKSSLDVIVFTDYLEFHLYEQGVFVDKVAIAEVRGDKIAPLPEHHEKALALFQRVASSLPQKIKSSKKLAEIMAGKARLLARAIDAALVADGDSGSALSDQMKGFAKVLIHDITPREFADIYAQTITYGLFAARFHDDTAENFTRMEAATLIPHTNPFLRKIFQHIAGYEIDVRIDWIVDDLVRAFRATDLKEILKGYGAQTQQSDPILHFYENFLAAYDPKLRQERGVFYTPLPVVRFIVTAVDDILKRDFYLPEGLADTAMVTVGKQKLHRVQVLDPATGTGTFLAEVVRHIHAAVTRNGQQGLWSDFVGKHLLPRIHGFEIMMASYAMAHLKLDLILNATYYTHCANETRLNVYLTNALAEADTEMELDYFTQWLSNEANGASAIKRDTPVMVVLGNPPYSGESKNKGDWIMRLMEDYKKEPGGKEKLKERNPKWINDDYCKFIRLGQDFVDRNREGVLAFINNHGFLDNLTFRGMRWHLLNSFDTIYILDLHGYSKKKVAPDGGKDENVFNIQRGVSINIFVKTGKKKPGDLAEVYHCDLYGKREDKYAFLAKNTIATAAFTKIGLSAPFYFFVPRDSGLEGVYNSGFSVAEIFPVNSVGIVTSRDEFCIQHDKTSLETLITTFKGMDDNSAREYFHLGPDSRDWQIALAREDLNKGVIAEVDYRPFDIRWTCFTGNSRGFHCMPRGKIMRQMIVGNNIALLVCKQMAVNDWVHVSISKHLVDDSKISNRTKERGYVYPLYLYTEQVDGSVTCEPNLDRTIFEQIQAITGEVSAIEVFDYIYGVLHTPSYREKFKSFLKSDFPRIPYPVSAEAFREVAVKGGELRRLHLMEADVPTITTFPVGGTNGVDHLRAETQPDGLLSVWVNATQFFGKVTPTAWEFRIGGYQPAQKWLKDRRGRTLTYEDIRHYQKIVAILQKTADLMATL